jgi:hypothetical protein
MRLELRRNRRCQHIAFCQLRGKCPPKSRPRGDANSKQKGGIRNFGTAEHKDDIPTLLHQFIDHYNQKFHKNIQGLTQEADDLLMNYNCPGNIRELRNAIERE